MPVLDPHVLRCPQCNAPLKPPSRFARSTNCTFCGSNVQLDPANVSSARFKQALEDWTNPIAAGPVDRVGDGFWSVGAPLGRGEASDVFHATRARWPSERVVMKLLRDEKNAALLDHEWQALTQLQQSNAAGADRMTLRIPSPVIRGKVESGPHAGRRALATGWAPGFLHSAEAVHGRYPAGIAPKAAVWVWRRILETLSFVHRSGFAHGAVLPEHLLIQKNEHGVRLIGYSCADRPGTRLRLIVDRLAGFYPRQQRESMVISVEGDLRMAARCVVHLLGGDASSGKTPAAVPEPLHSLLRQAASDEAPNSDAWALRERVGEAAAAAFGPPSFNPISMPD